MTGPQTVAVLGASGFIGSELVAYGQSSGVAVARVTMPRIRASPDGGATVAEIAAQWCLTNRAAFEDLCLALAPFDAVINAAGNPQSGSSAWPALFAANAVLPAIVARAACSADVRRMLHISTAAVQGRLDPLVETSLHCPLSPYARSKAQGERVLLDAEPTRGEVTAELVIYRPASVQAIGHQATRTFARVVGGLPFVPLEGYGDRLAPVAQLANVAAGILFAATMEEPSPIVGQPDENMTVRRLVELFGARRIVSVPPRAANRALDGLGRLTRTSAYLTSRLRWIELLLRGQGTEAKVLPAAGFTVPFGHEGWEALAEAERAHLQRRTQRRRTQRRRTQRTKETT